MTSLPPEAALLEALEGRNRSAERKTVYWMIVVVLVGGSLLLQGGGHYRSTVQAHTLMESLATLMAFLIGGLA